MFLCIGCLFAERQDGKQSCWGLARKCEESDEVVEVLRVGGNFVRLFTSLTDTILD